MSLSSNASDEAVIRAAVADDAAALAEFAERSFRDTFERDNRPEDMAEYVASAFGAALQRAAITDPRGVVLLAELDARIIGYAQLCAGETPTAIAATPAMELARFYVAREWHGRGLAQRLMQRAIAVASEGKVASKAATLWLAVWERNPRAISFYRKFGFTDVGSTTFVLGSDLQTDRVMVRPVGD